MLRGEGRDSCLPPVRVVTVDSKVTEAYGPQPPGQEQATPEELAPPGTRVLQQSFRKDGSRYRPGERLEKQARRWAEKNNGGASLTSERSPSAKDPLTTTWSRKDARETLNRLMAELAVE